MEAERNEKIFNSISKVINTYKGTPNNLCGVANTTRVEEEGEIEEFEEMEGETQHEEEVANEEVEEEEESRELEDGETEDDTSISRPEDSNKLLLQCRNKINLKLLENARKVDDVDNTKVLIILPGGKQQIIPLNVLDGMKSELVKSCSQNGSSDNKENVNTKKLKMVRKKKEPELLVLSSDDEEEQAEDTSRLAPQPACNDEDQEEYSGGIAEYIMENKQSGTFTTLECKWARIGSYKVKPNGRVLVSANCLVMVIPSVETHTPVLINIHNNEILKFITHFGRSILVVFMFVLPTTAAKIRKSLQMTDTNAAYFDPVSQNETHKRITFILDKMTDDKKGHLELIFDNNVYDELTEAEARQVLTRACQTEDVDSVQKILIYPPPPEKGGITINSLDYCCLGSDQFLNDVIIDFYMKYLMLKVLSDRDKGRTHVFSTFFFKRLTTVVKRKSGGENQPSLSEIRHANVEKWTKNVNLFEKDFIIIPINEESHWFLAIICFPGMTEPETTEEGVVKQPLIIIFDSLLDTDHNNTIDILREYLRVEFEKKIGGERTFDEVTVKSAVPSVPQQDNYSDCGVFVLEYVEAFFRDPIKNFNVPMDDLTRWFDIGVIARKRRAIAQLITELIEEQGGELYEIGLPSLFSSDEDDELDDEEYEEHMEMDPFSKESLTNRLVNYDDTDSNQSDIDNTINTRPESPVCKKIKLSPAD